LHLIQISHSKRKILKQKITALKKIIKMKPQRG